jgi:hypothetical protein
VTAGWAVVVGKHCLTKKVSELQRMWGCGFCWGKGGGSMLGCWFWRGEQWLHCWQLGVGNQAFERTAGRVY